MTLASNRPFSLTVFSALQLVFHCVCFYPVRVFFLVKIIDIVKIAIVQWCLVLLMVVKFILEVMVVIQNIIIYDLSRI